MFATQKGRSKPVRISSKRSEKVNRAPKGRCGAGALARDQLPMRSRTCWAVRPKTRITLFRLVWPAAIVTEERGRFKSFAKNSMQAALALPSTGGLVMASFSASPTSPVIAFFLARGWTLTAKVIPLDEFLIAIIERRYHGGHRGTQGMHRGNLQHPLDFPLCT